MKRILIYSITLLLTACKATQFPPKDDRFAHVVSQHLFLGVRFNRLVSPDSIGGLNKEQFNDRYERTKGPVPVIAFMDSCGYELKAMTGRYYGGIFTFRQDYDLIFQKRR